MEQFLAAKDSFSSVICSATCTDRLANVRSEVLMKKRNVTKEKTCEWLESVCVLLESVVPLLESASKLPDEISKLKDEKIVDSASIIGLQKKLIEKQEEDMAKIVELQDKLIVKKEENLGEVKTVVQSEMKSYASLFKNTCNDAFAPRKLHAAVKRVNAQDDRSKNIILYGLDEIPEEDLDILQSGVEAVFVNLNERPAILNVSRIGKETPEGVRPIKISLHTM